MIRILHSLVLVLIYSLKLTHQTTQKEDLLLGVMASKLLARFVD